MTIHTTAGPPRTYAPSGRSDHGRDETRTWFQRLALASAALSLALAGCGGSTPSATPTGSSTPATFSATAGTAGTADAPPKAGGELTVAIVDELAALDPTSARYTPGTLMVAKAVFDPLVAVSREGAPVPYLAASLRPSADFRTWTLGVRGGVTFHDGNPVDPPAIADHFTRLQKSILTQDAVRGIERVTANGNEVVLSMRSPWAAFPTLLTGQLGMVASPGLDSSGRVAHGSGPFRIRSWDAAGVKTAKNPNYWRSGLPYLDGVMFKTVPDDGSRSASLKTGDVDLIQSGDPDGVAALLSEQPERVIDDTLSADKATIIFNTLSGDLQDVSLRKALAQAVDRQAMVDQFGSGLLRVSNGPGGPSWGAISTYPRYDLVGARSVVDAFVQANGRPPALTIATIPGSSAFSVLAAYLQQQWTDIGVKVDIELVEPTALTLSVATGSFDSLLVAYWADDDPDAFRHFFHSDSYKPVPAISLNLSRYRNEVVDRAFDDGRASADPVVRKNAYQRAWDQMGLDVPMIFLFDNNWVVAWNPSIQNVGGPTSPDGVALQPNRWGSTFLTEVWRS